MKSTGLESWSSLSETRDVSSARLTLNYITAIFTTDTLSHFLDDFTYKIGCKMF